MAQMIGGAKSRLWWLAGSLCALLFGSAAAAGEKVQPAYGTAPAPGFVAKIAPLRPPDAPPDAAQQAEKLIDAYLEEQKPGATPADLEKKLAGCIKDLGDEEWAKREAASEGLVKIGKPALPALREVAASSKDPEVVQRVNAAIARIEGAGSTLESLRALGGAGQTAIQARIAQERKVIIEQAGAAAEAELAGRKEEAEKLRAEAKASQARVGPLTKLLELLAQAQPAAGPGPTVIVPLLWDGIRVVE